MRRSPCMSTVGTHRSAEKRSRAEHDRRRTRSSGRPRTSVAPPRAADVPATARCPCRPPCRAEGEIGADRPEVEEDAAAGIDEAADEGRHDACRRRRRGRGARAVSIAVRRNRRLLRAGPGTRDDYDEPAGGVARAPSRRVDTTRAPVAPRRGDVDRLAVRTRMFSRIARSAPAARGRRARDGPVEQRSAIVGWSTRRLRRTVGVALGRGPPRRRRAAARACALRSAAYGRAACRGAGRLIELVVAQAHAHGALAGRGRARLVGVGRRLCESSSAGAITRRRPRPARRRPASEQRHGPARNGRDLDVARRRPDPRQAPRISHRDARSPQA